MTRLTLNINCDAVIEHTARLGRMGKSAMPLAVREALTSTAYDVKKNTMLSESDVFVHRAPTFFKATSKVVGAKGFDINTMEATVGFVPSGTSKEKGGATEDLEEQEHGGEIGHRAFIPLAAARAGGNWLRNVRKDLRMSIIRAQIIDAKNAEGDNDKEKFTKSAIHAKKGGFVIGTSINSKSEKMLMRINSVHRLKKSTTTKAGKKYESGDTVINSTAVYSVQAHRAVRPKATHFMRKASLISEKRMETFYVQAAYKQLAKLK